MADQEYEPPILISESDGMLRVTYDEVSVEMPSDGPVPASAPPLARRIFEAFRHDL